MTDQTWTAKRTDRLWGTLRVWAVLFIVTAGALAACSAYRAFLFFQLEPDAFANEFDAVGGEAELWATGGVGLAYIVLYLVGALLTLIWYLRSVRNGHALGLGVTTRPGLVVWWFILPVVSLWKPYEITSQLWRSSHRPDGWSELSDPVLLRWWWATVLIGGFLVTIADAFSRAATTAGQLTASESGLALAYGLQAVAGVLFLRIGGPISRLQTALVLKHEATKTFGSEPPST